MDARRVKLPFSVKKPILACGADLKGAFALAKRSEAFLYEGFGGLSDLGNFEKYEEAIKKAIKKTGIKPAIIAHDMHPGYFSTRFARDLAARAHRTIQCAVQHHEAHIASCMIDNNIKGSVIGVAFDGTGYGADGNIWGGEFFVGGLKSFKRSAHLEYVAMPGGDAAVREPWRMAESYRYTTTGKCGSSVIKKMIDRKINSPLTSSAGRLFDAAASIVLSRKKADFEAELPMELERIAAADCEESYIIKSGSSASVIKNVMADIDKGTSKEIVSAKFHNTIANMIAKTSSLLGKKCGIKKIIFSGGVFQNKYLMKKVIKYMEKSGSRIYKHEKLSTTDSSIPIGQIAITQARFVCV